MSGSALKRIFLPGIILQSVLIGGGYATGREIVEYGAKFGASGWVCSLAIFFCFSLMSILSMEACWLWSVYDYKSLLKKMIDPGWIAYEIVYLLLAVLIIAVMASAAEIFVNYNKKKSEGLVPPLFHDLIVFFHAGNRCFALI